MASGDTARAVFAIDLDSNIPSSAAGVTAALDSLKDKLEQDTQSLRGMQLAMQRLKGSGAVGSEALKKLRDQIAAQKATIAQSQAAYLKLGGSFSGLKASTKPATSALTELRGALQASGGPLASFSARLVGLGKVGAVGLTAGVLLGIAAAIAAVTAATIAGAAALVRYGIASADARRNELLRLEGLSKLRNYWGELLGITRKADSGQFLQGVVDQVTQSVALGREQVAGLAEEFYRAGLRSGDLQAAVEGASIALATQGEAGKEQFKALALGAALYGRSVRSAADDVKNRLGGIAKAQLLSLGVQAAKARENFGLLFRDLKLDGLLRAVQGVLDMFSQATAVGQALRSLASNLLQPLLDWVGRNGKIIKYFFLGLGIAALQVGLVVLSLRDKLREILPAGALRGIDLATVSLNAAKFAVYAFAAGLTVMGLAITALVGPVALLALPFVTVGAAVTGLVMLVRDAYQWLAGIKWEGIGTRIIAGLVDGLRSGYERVAREIKGLVDRITGGFMRPLQIHSPSRVFFDFGRNIDRGAELGIKSGAPQVQSAVDDLVPTAPSRADTNSRAQGGITVQVSEGAIVLQLGAQADPEDMMAALKRGLVDLLRGAAHEAAVI